MTTLESTLTLEEIDTLLDALDKWVADSLDGEVASMMFGAMFADRLEENTKAKHDFEAMQKKRQDEREAEKRRRSEMAAILKAKLTLIRREMVGNPL